MVQSGFTSTNDPYDSPPTGPPPPMSPLASPMLPPMTYPLTNQRTSRLIEMRSRTNEVEESWGLMIGIIYYSLFAWQYQVEFEDRRACWNTVLMITPWCWIRSGDHWCRTYVRAWMECAPLTAGADAIGPWDHRGISRLLLVGCTDDCTMYN